MKSYGLCNFVESLFSHVVLIFRETLFTCFTWNDMMPSISKNQGVFKINVFSYCFPRKRKSSYDFVVTAWFLMWTSLGLNQGPPDYESVALTNWATSPILLHHKYGVFVRAKVRRNGETAKFQRVFFWKSPERHCKNAGAGSLHRTPGLSVSFLWDDFYWGNSSLYKMSLDIHEYT